MLGMYWMAMLLLATFSLKKCTSNSMFLVRAWNLGLLAKAAVLWLSHQMIGVRREVRPISVSKDLIHKISNAAIANVWHSNWVLDQDTPACFLEHHETIGS